MGVTVCWAGALCARALARRGIADARFEHTRLGRTVRLGGGWTQIQELVEQRRNHSAQHRPHVPNPGVGPVVADELWSERARGFIAAPVNGPPKSTSIEFVRPIASPATALRTACVDGRSEHDKYQEERQDRLE